MRFLATVSKELVLPVGSDPNPAFSPPWLEGPEIGSQGCDLRGVCDNGAEKRHCDGWLDSQGTRSELAGKTGQVERVSGPI